MGSIGISWHARSYGRVMEERAVSVKVAPGVSSRILNAWTPGYRVQ